MVNYYILCYNILYMLSDSVEYKMLCNWVDGGSEMSRKKIIVLIGIIVAIAFLFVLYLVFEEETTFEDMSAKDFETAFNKDMDKDNRINKPIKAEYSENFDICFYDFHDSVDIWIGEKSADETINIIRISCELSGDEEVVHIFDTVIMQAILISTDRDEEVRSDICDELKIAEIKSLKPGDLFICDDVNDIKYTFGLNDDDVCSLIMYIGRRHY